MLYTSTKDVLEHFRQHFELQEPPELVAEIRRHASDVNDLGELVNQHPALATEVLEIINAPFFALVREIPSVIEAVRFLGPPKIINLTTGRALYHALYAKKGKAFESFWRLSNKLAVTMVVTSKVLGIGIGYEAHTCGLFQNSGLPLMYMKYKRYGEVLKEAYSSPGGQISRYEAEHSESLHHAGVSALIAEKWQLDPHIVDAICMHHSPVQIADSLAKGINETNNLLVISKIAEDVARLPGYLCKVQDNHEWEHVIEPIMDYLKKPPSTYERLKNNIKSKLAEYKD